MVVHQVHRVVVVDRTEGGVGGEEVRAGEDARHAGVLLRAARVDPPDARVGEGASQGHGVKHPGHLDMRCVGRVPPNLRRRLGPPFIFEIGRAHV